MDTVNGGVTVFSADLNLAGDQDNNNDTMSVSIDFEDALPPVPTAALDTVCGAGAYDTLYFSRRIY
ncbi:MAG: hypothetical protein U5L96_02940 [Owenweeksia sp.]|nr:hypothetical protein [Owenweeksia sp.]